MNTIFQIKKKKKTNILVNRNPNNCIQSSNLNMYTSMKYIMIYNEISYLL